MTSGLFFCLILYKAMDAYAYYSPYSMGYGGGYSMGYGGGYQSYPQYTTGYQSYPQYGYQNSYYAPMQSYGYGYGSYQPYYAGYGNAEMPSGTGWNGDAGQGGDYGGGQGCTSSDSCQEDNVCYSGQCYAAVPTRTQCQSDGQCQGGGCKFNYCWTVGGASGDGQPGYDDQPGGDGHQPNEQQTCGTQDDCQGNQICSEVHKNYCVDGHNLGYPCTGEKNCDRQDVCKQGTCWKEGEDPGKPIGSECKKDDECVAQAVCENDFCRGAIVTTKKCLVEIQCSGREACRHGYCWSVTDEIADENSMTPCAAHTDCPGNAICSELHANRCMAGHTIGTPCMAEKDCHKEFVCKENQCWKEGADRGFPTGSSCGSDEQCAAFNVCEEGFCKAATRQEKTCKLELQCGKASACRFGFCWTVNPGQDFKTQDEPGGPCKSQADCGPDEVCSDVKKDQCMKGHSLGIPCMSEKDCSKKHVCKNGECWMDGVDHGAPAGSECSKDDQCAAKMVCERDRCKPAVVQEKTCWLESSCGHNSACRYGRCWLVEG